MMTRKIIKASVIVLSFGLISTAYGAPDTDELVGVRSKNLFLLSAGYGTGTFGASLEYENLKTSNFGYSAQARVYSSLNKETSPKFSPGLFTLGVAVKPHIQIGPIDLSVSPGIGVAIINSTSRDNSVTSLGPSLSIAALYAVNTIWSFGLEHFQLYDWTDSLYRGQVANDLMFKIRYAY